MSDELDKLAAEMQKMKPSKSSRARGMDAAMAAFDTEFAAQTETAPEKISASPQGLAADGRPTGQTIRTRRVQAEGNSIMSKINTIFKLPTKPAMMMGSCAAALMFAMIVVPGATNGVFETKTTEKITEGVKPDLPSNAVGGEIDTDEIVIIGTKIKKDNIESAAPVDVVTAEDIGQLSDKNTADVLKKVPTTEPAPKAKGQGINSVSDLLNKVSEDSAKSESERVDREARFRTRNDQQSGLLDQTDRTIREYRAVLQQKDNAELFVVQQDILPGYIDPISQDQFDSYESNPVTLVSETPVSTFSIDVDTASYSFLRASINRGQLPRPGSIRLEEMINYFPYDYEAPKSEDEPFKANVTVTSTPWNADTKLMHIGIKGYVPPASERPRSNIVFLIDTSGSMNNANKLPLLINSFKLLLNTLDEDDTVSIVTYAGRAGTVLEPTAASNKAQINEALTRLRAGGSTAGAAGLELAYQKAEENFDDVGVNRVILATDGDFNVGFSSPDEMKTFIEKKRETGIFLSVLGFGMGNYNDHLMQSLAQNGNGVAAYIDSLAEANKVLANESGSALFTIAKDVKIQVEFNPETISEYRLIGYETRALKRQDFNNDKIDAGEINSGHTVTAIYEMTPVGSPATTIDKLRYVMDRDRAKTSGSDEFAFVKIRHKLPSADTSTLQTFPIGPKQERSLKRSSDDMRFATAVAAFGQKLRGDTPLAEFSYDDTIELALGAKGEDENGYRAEFIQLMRLAETLDK